MPAYKKVSDKTGRVSWFTSFYYRDWNGQRKQKKREGFTTRRDALQYEHDFLERLAGSPEMSFDALADRYLDDLAARLKPSTVENKRILINHHLRPAFGSLALSDITPAIIRQWQNDFAANGFTRSYMAAVHGALSAVFNHAVKFYGLLQNPCKLAGPMGQMKREAPQQFLTLKQFEAIRDAMRDDGKEILATAVSFLFLTGCREGEMLALTRADIDLEGATVSINKTFYRLHRQDLVSSPKTEKSRRVVIMPASLVAIMRDYFDKLGQPLPGQRIFDCISADSIRYGLNEYTSKAGLPHVRVHDLRHSHASLLIEQGVQPLAIAERLGHDSVKTTLETYSHLYPNKQQEIAANIDKSLAASKERENMKNIITFWLRFRHLETP